MGWGLGASSPQYGIAKEKDIDYLIAARESLNKSKFGVFLFLELGQ